MGYDCGFDIYPRLEATAEHKEAYQQFLDDIISVYEGVHDEEGRRDDGKVLEMPGDTAHSDKVNICFMVGECPRMPANPDRCNYFLRFSSKISGRLTAPAESYIRSVYKIARKNFGSRVHFWNDLYDEFGCYGWQQIYDAEKELRELEAGKWST
ncbi:hypothetical protein NW759_015760 [Fusarium solani]|jgi:hypothetical protein|nr:hypothetical protein NW759_015760 [Fusarium solani]